MARITDIDLVLSVSYPTTSGNQQTLLRDQVLVTFYSAPGDSGSGVLDMDNRAVGLHVGGSDIVGFFCKIGNILDRLGLEVVAQGGITSVLFSGLPAGHGDRSAQAADITVRSGLCKARFHRGWGKPTPSRYCAGETIQPNGPAARCRKSATSARNPEILVDQSLAPDPAEVLRPGYPGRTGCCGYAAG